MTKATAMQVFSALSLYPISIVDALNTRIYFSEPVSESAIHAIVDPLGWTDVNILIIDEDLIDPYPQYLNSTRHDSLLRHSLGTVVPHDNLSGLLDCDIDSPADGEILVYASSKWGNVITIDSDATLTANSDDNIATQKAIKEYVDVESLINAIILRG